MRIAGVSLFALLTLVVTGIAAEPTEPDLLAALEKRLKAANEKAGPCVGCVVVSKSNRYPKGSDADQPGRLGGFDKGGFLKAHPDQMKLAVSLDLSDPLSVADHGYACGVVIDAEGLILTPYHVIEGATKVYVHLQGRTGSYANIHAADARHDLAVLKLITPPVGLTAITFGDARVREQNGKVPAVTRGKLTVLVGSGYLPGAAADKPTASLGSVSSVYFPKRQRSAGTGLSEDYYHYGPLIAHDARLNTGVDGAALLNLDGELIGLTTSTPRLTGERGPSYAFPVDEYFRNVVAVLRKGEEVEYGYLGVSIPSEDPIQRVPGLSFPRVMPRGPAARARIDESDILTHVNGAPTTTYEDLLLQIGSALAGSKVKLTLRRDGRDWTAEVTLGKFAHKQPFIASVRPEPVFGLRVEYSSVLVLSLIDNNPQVNSGGLPLGVCVRELTPNSPAAKKLGDRAMRLLITRLNGTEVTTPAEFYKAAAGQKSIKLTFLDPTESNPREQEVTIP